MIEIVVALALAVLRVHGENRGVCADGKCFAVQTDGASFDEAQLACEEKGGHLMTVRTETVAGVLAGLLNGSSGDFWLGLKYAGDRCSDSRDGLKGFKWVTGDVTGGYSNWRSDATVCPRLCVSVSREDHKWIERPCDEALDGYLCEFGYSSSSSCQPLSTDAPVTYKTAFGFTANELLREIPEQTNATLQPLGTRHVCFDANWLRAPWSCEVFAGGCDHKCVRDAHGYACVCPPGFKLDGNGVTCSEQNEDKRGYVCNPGFQLAPDGTSCECAPGFATAPNGTCVDVDECESSPCEHMCDNTYGSYHCRCFEGYKQSTQDVHKCKMHCEEVRCKAECDPNISTQCDCPDGFLFEEESGYCVDIDECNYYCDQTHPGGCINHPGGYECLCDEGFVLTADEKCVSEDFEGSGSSSPFDVSTPTSRSPTDRPLSISAGSLLGIMMCIVGCVVLLVCLAHCIMRRIGKMHQYDMHKGQDELYDFQQVIIDKNSTQSIPNRYFKRDT